MHMVTTKGASPDARAKRRTHNGLRHKSAPWAHISTLRISRRRSMSVVGSKSEVRVRNREVCFAPNIGHRARPSCRLKSARTRLTTTK